MMKRMGYVPGKGLRKIYNDNLKSLYQGLPGTGFFGGPLRL
jgi:hypothetical protein